MLHFLQVVQAFDITLKSAFQWHIIACSNTLSETKIALEYDLKRVINTCRALLKQVGHLIGQLCALFHYQVSSRATEMSPLCTVNATRGEELRVEEFPPNVTSFSIRRYDRYTRYRFSVAARTAIGIGEWYTEESPHYTTESNS